MTVEPLAKEFRSAIVITGMLADAKGSDTNNEYIQFMALEEIDFAQTPPTALSPATTTRSTPRAGCRAVTLPTSSTSPRAVRPRGTFFYVGGVNKRLNGNSSADISGANWICSVDYNTQAGADGIGDKTRILHNYNSNGKLKISPTASLFSRVRRSTKKCPVRRGLLRRQLPRTSQPGRLRLPDSRQRSLQQHEEPPVGRRSALLRAGNQYVPLSRRRQRCRGVRFFGGSLRRAVTIAAVRLSAGSWPPMLRDRSPTSKKRGRRYDLSLIPEGGALRLLFVRLPGPFRKERAFWNIFCRFIRISPHHETVRIGPSVLR